MRVLYVNHTARISGGEISLLTLLGGLPDSIEPIVACPRGDLADALHERGVAVAPIRGTDGSLRLHPVRTPQALLEMAAASHQVSRIAEQVDAGVVHANSIRSGLIAVAPGVSSGLPTVVHVRDCLPPGRATDLTLRAIDRADALIANSGYTRDSLGPGASRADVVFNAVDLERFGRVELSVAEARRRLEIPTEGPVLGVVAQITPWKGQDDAIRIAKALTRSHPRLQLLLVGSPKFDSASTRYDNAAYLESLQGQVAEEGLAEAVRFLGERDDVPEVLRALDVLLVPSWEEPFGRSIVEAMAAGVTVAATSAGGPPEIVDEEFGLLLPPRDPDAWVGPLDELLSKPTRRLQMSSAARAVAHRDFSVERHVEAVSAVYERIASGASTSSRNRR